MASGNKESDSETNPKTTILTNIPTKPSPTTTNHPTPTLLTNHQLLFILPLLSLLGLSGTMILSTTNNLFPTITSIVETPAAKFPGTKELLLKQYTKLRWIDHQLTILVTFFAPVTDSTYERAGLGLFSVFGLGQFGAAWTVMVMESLRVGNRGLGVSFIGTTGLIFQNISFTITTPLWLMLHLLTSPIAKLSPGTNANSILQIPAWDLRVLPFSIAISYLLPSVMMGLPFSSNTHQSWIAIWQPFPLWTVILQYLLRTVAEQISKQVRKTDSKTRLAIPQGEFYLNNAKWVYQFVIGLCMVTHIPVLLIAIVPSWIFPSTSPLLARMRTETFSSIYVSSFPSLHHRISGLAEGAHIFLHWDLYIGSTALLLWAGLLYRNVTEKAIVDPTSSLSVNAESLTKEKPKKESGEKVMGKLILKMIGCFLTCGPMGILAMLLWQRDTVVKQKVKQGA